MTYSGVGLSGGSRPSCVTSAVYENQPRHVIVIPDLIWNPSLYLSDFCHLPSWIPAFAGMTCVGVMAYGVAEPGCDKSGDLRKPTTPRYCHSRLDLESIFVFSDFCHLPSWIPAFAGMTCVGVMACGVAEPGCDKSGDLRKPTTPRYCHSRLDLESIFFLIGKEPFTILDSCLRRNDIFGSVAVRWQWTQLRYVGGPRKPTTPHYCHSRLDLESIFVFSDFRHLPSWIPADPGMTYTGVWLSGGSGPSRVTSAVHENQSRPITVIPDLIWNPSLS